MSTDVVYAKALYDYDDAANGNVLTMREGETITITEIRQDGWWAGKIGDRVGYFPSNYVEVINGEGTSVDAAVEMTTFGKPSTTSTAISSEGSTPSFNRLPSIQSQTSASNLNSTNALWASERSSTSRLSPEMPGTTKIIPGDDKRHSYKPFSPYESRKTEDHSTDKGPEVETAAAETAVGVVVIDANKTNSSIYENWWTRDKRARYTCFPCRKRGFVLSKAQYYSLNCFLCGLVFMTGLLIVLYAIVPIIIKNAMGGSQLQFTSITITNPQATSMDVLAIGMISGAGPISAKLGAMTMYISELNPDGTTTLIGSITMPSMTVSGDTQLVSQTTMNIMDMGAFNGFTKHMIFDDFIHWHLEASATVTPMFAGIPGPTYTNIPFSKDITLPGCAGLKDAQLVQFQLLGGTASGAASQINLRMVNPSIFSIIPIGNLHFEMFVNGSKLGDVYGTNQNMVMGVNEMVMSAIIHSPNASFITNVFNRYLNKITTDIEAIAAPLDASSIPLYAAGMTGLTLNTTLVPPNATNNFVARLGVSLLSGSESCMNNPFPAVMQIQQMKNGAVYFQGNLMANINQVVNFTLNSNAFAEASPILQPQNLQLGTALGFIGATDQVLDIYLTVDLLIGGIYGYPVEINIHQIAIPATFYLSPPNPFSSICALAV